MTGWTILLLALATLTFGCLLAAAYFQVRRLEHEVRFVRARNHTACIMDIKEAVSRGHDAALMRRLADKWDSTEEQGNLKVLAREQYTPGGPSMPALWLRQQADQTERNTLA
jgi:hypothetical protein